MGLNPWIALLIAVAAVFLAIKAAKISAKTTMKEFKRKELQANPLEDSEKISKEDVLEEASLTSVAEEQLNENIQLEKGKATNNWAAKISLGGMILILIYAITKDLSTGLTDTENKWSFVLFVLCWIWNSWAVNQQYMTGGKNVN